MPIFSESGIRVDLGDPNVGTEELDLPEEERQRRANVLRGTLNNLRAMLKSESEPPKKRIVRKSHEEPLNMAQDTFLTSVEIELTVLLKRNVIDRPADLKRLEFYKSLIREMFLKKEQIKETGKKEGFNERQIFKSLRAQRRRDITTLKNIIEIIEEIVYDCGTRLGVNLLSE